MHTLAVIALPLVFAQLVSLSNLSATIDRWNPVVSPPLRIMSPFDVKLSEYEAGHRGIDLRVAQGQTVFSPVNGDVHFVGTVVDRGVITIRTDTGVLVSLEPVVSGRVPEESIRAGDPIAMVAGASHCGTHCLHVGVRVDGRYVNPLRFLVGERPRLLPLR